MSTRIVASTGMPFKLELSKERTESSASWSAREQTFMLQVESIEMPCKQQLLADAKPREYLSGFKVGKQVPRQSKIRIRSSGLAAEELQSEG